MQRLCPKLFFSEADRSRAAKANVKFFFQHLFFSLSKQFSKKISIVFFTLCINSVFSQSQIKDPVFLTNISVNGFYSHYRNNPNHTKNTSQLFSCSFLAREEWRFSQDASLVAGAEFFAHGLKFDSYYFPPEALALYNGRFNSHYKINMYEIDVPVLLRGNLRGKKRSAAVGYFEIGPSLRWLLSSNITVTDSSGNVKLDGSTKINFEYPLFQKNISMFMHMNTGVQFYHGDKIPGLFLELNFRYAPIRFLISESFTANSLYVQNFHMGLGIGMRF